MATPTRATLKRINELHVDAGEGPYAIARILTERRCLTRNGGRQWTPEMVRAELRRLAIYTPKPQRKTSPEAREFIIRHSLAGANDREIREALNASDLRPANGGEKWSDVTVRRVREQTGFASKGKTNAERFFANVRVDKDTDCEIWVGPKHNGEYGRFEVDGKHELAHRWRFEQDRGEGSIPARYHLHHSCKNPACVNPAHLWPVPASEHKPLELEEDAINRAASDGTLLTELQSLGSDGWPEWTADPPRLGAKRPTLVGAE